MAGRWSWAPGVSACYADQVIHVMLSAGEPNADTPFHGSAAFCDDVPAALSVARAVYHRASAVRCVEALSPTPRWVCTSCGLDPLRGVSGLS